MSGHSHRLTAVLAAPCLLLFAACGASSGTGAVTSPTALATATSTPTPDVRAIAAQQYLAVVTAYNKVNDAANAAYAKIPSGSPWSALVPAARTVYAAATVEQQAVFAIHFPADMTGDVSAFVSSANSELVALGNFITNPSQTSWSAYTTTNTAAGSASNAIRRDLGLQPVPLPTP